MYKVRVWLAIAELRALSAKWRERRKLELGVRRGEAMGWFL